MDPSIFATFANFGYPALITGVLLYIIVNKIEGLITRIDAVEKALLALSKDLEAEEERRHRDVAAMERRT